MSFTNSTKPISKPFKLLFIYKIPYKISHFDFLSIQLVINYLHYVYANILCIY